MRVVAVGECMVEVAPAAGVDHYRLGFAGDTMNTAWYLAQLRPGWTVDYVSAAGRDAISDRMVAFLDAAGIGTAHVARRAERTLGLYLISLDGGERQFSYWRGQSAARRLADDAAALDRAFVGADLIYFSGITLAILEDGGRDRLGHSLARARRAGSRIAFDPNLRPRLWADPDEMRAAVTAAAAAADIVLPSHADEADAFGDRSPPDTLARYRDAGAPDVAVKDGGNPVVWALGGRRGTSLPPAADPVDTTAAGDSFNAGLLAGLLAGAAPEATVAGACALAARVIGGRGALVAGAVRQGAVVPAEGFEPPTS